MGQTLLYEVATFVSHGTITMFTFLNAHPIYYIRTWSFVLILPPWSYLLAQIEGH